jgi:hypothetical protein
MIEETIILRVKYLLSNPENIHPLSFLRLRLENFEKKG